jgi:competence ComEA-like helix-hairpin-helix protein
MGIYDRDYMREGDEPADWWKPGYSIKRWLTIGIIAVSLLTSVVFLGRSIGIPKLFTSRAPVTKHSSPLTRHEKGSLRVNINTATIEELQTLPGIGPAKARLIVANRPYQSVDDLAKLQGIGQKLTANLRSFIKIDGTTEQLPSR